MCEIELDATETRAPAFGHCSTCGSGTARAGRFSTSDRIDTVICSNLSRSLLGKRAMATREPEVGNRASQLASQKLKGQREISSHQSLKTQCHLAVSDNR